MWEAVVTYELPMKDKFIVQRNLKADREHRWRGLIQNKNGDTRVCCHPTQFKFYVDEYFKIACLCQKDCLEGRNPYVSQEYACI